MALKQPTRKFSLFPIVMCAWCLLFVVMPSPVNAAPILATGETTLMVKVIPRGSEVILNGVVMGKAPFLIKNPPLGQITLRARHMGYRSWSRNVEITPGTLNSTMLILARQAGDPSTRTGVLELASEPSGAVMVLDEATLGPAPIRAEGIREGMHDLVSRFTGMGERSERVQVIGGEIHQITVKWQKPQNRKLHLEITPKDAKVQFLNDDEPYKQDMTLLPGRYLLRASHPGFVTTDIAVEITDKDFHSWISLQSSNKNQAAAE